MYKKSTKLIANMDKLRIFSKAVVPFQESFDANMFVKDGKILSASSSENEFTEGVEGVYRELSRTFSSFSSSASYDDDKMRVHIRLIEFYAFLENGRRRVVRKQTPWCSWTLRLDTGRIIFYYNNHGKPFIRTVISITREKFHFMKMSNPYIDKISTYELMIKMINQFYNVLWLDGICTPISLEDIHMTRCNIQMYMKRRFKNIFDKRMLYYRDYFVPHHFDYDELQSILSYLNFNDERHSQHHSLTPIMEEYYINRYGVEQQTANDYLRMCIKIATIPRIHFENKRHFDNYHVDMAKRLEVTDITFEYPENIPVEVKTNNLQLNVIQDGIQLYRESVEQANCVNSYANDIERCRKIIYSGFANESRITVELAANGSKYYSVTQVVGKANNIIPEALEEVKRHFDKHPVAIPEWVNATDLVIGF